MSHRISQCVYLTVIFTLATPGEVGAESVSKPLPGQAVDGLQCEISSFDAKLVLGSVCVLEISLKNVSDRELAIPRAASGGIGLKPAQGWEIFERANTRTQCGPPTIVSIDELVRIKPGGVYRWKHVTYLAKDKPDDDWQSSHFPPLASGKYQMHFTYGTHYALPREGLRIGEAKPWRGTLISAAVDVSVLAIPPHETVARLLATLKTNQDVNVRRLSLDAVSFLTCRRFGQNDGQEASVRALEAWCSANKSASREDWIVAAIGSGEPAERQLAAKRVDLVTDPRLRKSLLTVLDPQRPEVSDTVLRALWVNFQDQDSFAYARKVLGDESYVRRFAILALVRDNKIEPLQAECQAHFLAWLKREKNADSLRHLVEAAARFNFMSAVPILEELDRQGQGPLKELIISLGTLKGTAYESRLIEHLRGRKDEQRIWAAWSLFSWGTVASADALIGALSDPNEKVRSNACRALGRLGLRLSDAQFSAARDALVEMLARDEKVSALDIHNALLYITGVRPPTGAYSPNRKTAAAAWRSTVRRKP